MYGEGAHRRRRGEREDAAGLWAAARGRRRSGMLGSRGGVRAGMADVDGGGARRYNGTRGRWARAAGLWAATSTVAELGDVGLAWWGGAGDGGGTRRR